MPPRTVRIWPDPALTTPAKEVQNFDAALETLVADLFATMYAEEGIGLAANQVGELSRVLVIDLDPGKDRGEDAELDEDLRADNFTGPVALINPRIVATRGTLRGEEGCLSVPGVLEVVERHAEVDVEAMDASGKAVRLTARGLYAVCIQHEMDHLDGRVFVEYLSTLKRDVIRRKMVRQYKAAEAPKTRRKQRATG